MTKIWASCRGQHYTWAYSGNADATKACMFYIILITEFEIRYWKNQMLRKLFKMCLTTLFEKKINVHDIV